MENRLAVPWGGQVRVDWGFGISRCKLVYTEWVSNKLLLYRTGSYIQYPVINHNGKEYMCVELNHCAMPWKLTQPGKSTRLQLRKQCHYKKRKETPGSVMRLGDRF